MDRKTASKPGWLAGRMESKDFRKSFERHSLADDFIAYLETAMAREGVTRSELAKRMGCKPANVTRAMRNTTNLTIATMVDMAFALDCRVRVWVQPMASTSTTANTVAAQLALWSSPGPLLVESQTAKDEFAAVPLHAAAKLPKARRFEVVAPPDSLAA